MSDGDIGSVIGYLVQFPRFIPQVPLSHPDCPLNSEFGKISSLEESHEDPAENGYGAPGICRHYLFGSEKSFVIDLYGPGKFVRRI